MSSKGVCRICVVARGFVFVGYLSTESNELVIRNAKNIRRWEAGGLGKLVDGPSGATLDPAGTVRLHPLQMVYTLDVDEKKWAKTLSE